MLYPTKASAQVAELYITAGRNHFYASQGRASTNDLAERVRELFRQDAQLAAKYNRDLAGGKWDHMMDQTHIGYTSWQEPAKNVMPEVRELNIPNESKLGVSVEGSPSAWPGSSGEPALPTFDSFNRQVSYIHVRGKHAADRVQHRG